MQLSGILDVNKPPDWTSFDVVRFIRGQSRQKRVGHAGTLDPAATGVLPVLIGPATRLTEYLVDTTKEYVAEIEFGVMTDTYDLEGEVVSRVDASAIDESAVLNALDAFRGDIMQTPPVYSAIKRDGVALYKRARRGEDVRAEARPVRTEKLDIISFNGPYLRLRIVCGKGFYVRSLAHDLGSALGVGGALKSLVRSRVGSFQIKDAVDIETLRSEFHDGTWTDRLIAPDEILLNWRAAILTNEGGQDILNGRETALQPTEGIETAAGDLCRAYSESGDFLAILRCEEANRWRPDKVLSRA